ncbi:MULTISPECIES: hypothetical protein [Aneurinibacillus]|uniref:Uncharacterized protein n=1 Tax=Aneurinibacillus thermoaerophilus TaxID=143495 RepID=A0A1G7YDJ2_ANETH|nr:MULTISPECIES: hypothetical protein [Aneurinibacillus]AMA72213.1 hypothetical protein ACH33_04645 [Aneurinibacillus sp. XH2]MED0676500.1 hypothetical protein [Aneurinibacillus thermoaerophilus]MED0679012.1 hypothetical protein [Aneurinibacillus thermoaerophilus]MED0736549.1 hypothetical protein [Aneurinibacillus thermoaerophilus]MED0756053.1 hypothetical protein [Aneurinibacillus thermoaerophilus]
MSMTDAHIISLASVFNTKGVSTQDPTYVAQLDHVHSSIPGEIFPSDEIISYGGIPFFFPLTETVDNDVISCDGQIIEVNAQSSFQTLAFLGFSLFGDYQDKFIIRYVDGMEKEARFGLTNWKQYKTGTPLFGEQIAMSLPYYVENMILTELPRTIWLQKVSLQYPERIKQIILPRNPYLIIIALTLCNV